MTTFNNEVYTDYNKNYKCLVHFRAEDLNYPKMYKLISNVLIYYHRNQYSKIDFNMIVKNEAGHILLDNSIKRFSIQDLRALKAGDKLIDGEMRLGTFGIFGTEDELFSYIKEFKSKYGNRFIRISDKHRLNYKNLISTIQFAFDRFKDINKKINESIINEHFTNIVINDEDKTKLDEYKDVVYDILQKAYEPIGGILGCDNVDMLVNDSDFWKLFTRNGKVYACVIYTFKRGGRKLMYCGTDGTPEGKKALYTIIKDDLRLIDRKAWAEVSGAMEHIYIDKHGAIPIPAEVAQQLLEDKPFIKIHDDGFHYDRYIDGEVHTKIMVGIIPK